MMDEIIQRFSLPEIIKRQKSYNGREMKISRYDLRTLALQIENIREDPIYEDVHDWIIETTSSCDKKEAIGWMDFYMMDAIEDGYGKGPNPLLRAQFLAAYDICQSLKK
jgi:hypothetical protein